MALEMNSIVFWMVFEVISVFSLKSLDFNNILPDNPLEYDNLQPPKENELSPTIVEFHITVLSIDSIDEGSMTYVADIFMSQSWRDYRLHLPENITAKYRLLPIHLLNDIWRPDAFFKNAKRVTFQDMTIPNHYIWLYRDKKILYMVKLTLELSCAMKFESYPHDTQICSLKIESLSYTTDDLIFKWEELTPLVVDDDIELPQHILTDTRLGDCTKSYSTGNFTCIEVTFTLERRLGYYLFHTYIPTCLIVIMSWISFWIKVDAVPARVTLCVTSLLTLSTQHAQSQKSLPPVSYIKAIDIFMSSCTIFVFLSLMEYAAVNIIVTSGETKVAEANKKIVSNFGEEYVEYQNGLRKSISLSITQDGQRTALRVDKFSRFAFPFVFVALNVGLATCGLLEWYFYETFSPQATEGN